MAYEYDTKAVLLEWMKQGDNKLCFECDVPSPQWCSLSYGTYLCLTCSGTHRSLGVHLSFVRSLTMDKWTPAQIKRMEVGGNKKCRDFFQQSSEYDKGMSIPDKYNTHMAAQYRDKLLAEAEGRSWSPSDTPAPAASASSGSALRKPRLANSGRGSSPIDRSGSPASNTAGYNTPASASSGSGLAPTQKTANESYFSRLGAANDSRPDHLPPSQGGKYAGFGSQGPAYNAAEGTSSRALPSFDDIREDPVSAVSKGWGLFSAALGAVSKTVNESVIQPGLERAVDPNLQSQLSSYVSRAGTVLGSGARQGGQLLSTGLHSSSEILRREAGLNVGDLGAGYLDKVTGRGAGGGYAALDTHNAPAGADSNDFFDSHMGASLGAGAGERGGGGSGSGSASRGFGTPSTGRSSPLAYRDDSSSGAVDMGRAASPVPVAPTPPPPTIREGGWASLAPQSVARTAAAGGGGGAGSGRASPAGSTSSASARKLTQPPPLPSSSVKQQAQKADDDWDDFGKDDKWD